MREAVDAREFPFVVFKGTARLDEAVLAASQPTAEVSMQGEIELRGVKRPVTVPLTIELSPGSARARGRFEVSLDAFGVERPSLLFIKIEDACRIEVDLALRTGAP
jgi:polyisoprenoid-binding protein YceI